jgi:hypothetical protein
MGSNWQQYSECEQLLCEIMDVRNTVVNMVYGSRPLDEHAWLQSLAMPGESLSKLELWLERNHNRAEQQQQAGDVFFVGSAPTAPDFHIWEILDQLLAMSHHFHHEPDVLETFPYLRKFHAMFAQLPGNQRYFQSSLSKLPCNNITAKRFGAIPCGGVFESGVTQVDWQSSSGLY